MYERWRWVTSARSMGWEWCLDQRNYQKWELWHVGRIESSIAIGLSWYVLGWNQEYKTPGVIKFCCSKPPFIKENLKYWLHCTVRYIVGTARTSLCTILDCVIFVSLFILRYKITGHTRFSLVSITRLCHCIFTKRQQLSFNSFRWFSITDFTSRTRLTSLTRNQKTFCLQLSP